MPTGNEMLDGLASGVAGVNSVLRPGSETTDFLASAALELTEPNTGLVVSLAQVPISATSILYVSPGQLSLLDYPDADAYKAALLLPDFVHPDDLAVVQDHIRFFLTAPYDARLKRGTGTYRRLRLRGMTALFKGQETRFSLFRPVA